MCCAPRRSQRATRRRSSPSRAIIVLLGAAALSALSSQAEAASVTLIPSAAPAPMPPRTGLDSDLSAGATVVDLGSNFLERLGKEASSGFGRALRSNPDGGGASEVTDAPPYRAWGEGYGISAKTGPQLDFVGDRRQTWGGVAGLGANAAPGVNFGASVDQSRTSIDLPLALQSASLDLTQFGLNASVDRGPWTWAIALVHGFGKINSKRDTGFGISTAGYDARINGALSELSYFLNIDQSRLVPKAGLEYVRATTGSFQEIGGLNPLAASGASAERARFLLGAEIGRYWIADQRLFDLSTYGKFVGNISQSFSTVTVSLGPQSITVQGIGESRYGADAGASAGLSFANKTRLYVSYDGRFRSAMQSHQGTVGVELKW